MSDIKNYYEELSRSYDRVQAKIDKIILLLEEQMAERDAELAAVEVDSDGE